MFSRLLPQVPSLCAVCRGWGSQAVCPACQLRYAPVVPRCRRCALQVPSGVTVCGSCLTDPPAFEGALTGVDYAFPWSGLITQFKFHEALDLAPALAQRLIDAWHLQPQDPPPARPDLLLPVPLSAQRLRERGYNQAWELTRVVAKALQMEADPALLLRVKDTPHQLALPPQERAANVQGAFAVEPLRRAELAGRHIAVIDDVLTTGATLAEISRVLRQAGAARVDAWTIARTPRPGLQP